MGEEEFVNSIQKLANSPNPFLRKTSITFKTIMKNGVLEIFNMFGEKVESIMVQTDQTEINWNASDRLPGIYFARLKSGNKILANRKMVLVK